ncbi:META domain-containing protein [Jejuia spongiicola]|uniref:META domain-containing protein n=1 Tax=Jejuia spongiicola TaxID=2942207 RepID=A0ABT0Q9T9_9FLAO|nr:META domain-containing protein [Jejuia spongiicola]MCL6293742.1 META domain-containing protein [Jejuia spongiicola]
MKSFLMIFSIIVLRCCWGPTDFQLMLAQQNDNTLLKTLNGTYKINTLGYDDVSSYSLNITFDDNTKKVSGFAGCNRFFGTYSIKDNALTFGDIGSTKMMCQDEENKTETKLLKAFKKANLILFKEGGFSLYNKKKLLLSAEKEVENISVNFEYSALSRGTYKLININQKSVSLTNKQKGKPNTKVCREADWSNLMKTLKTVDVENIANLKAPSEDRFFDGAAIGNLKITYNGIVYESQSFDHGNPPKEIAILVKEILSISENIE